MPDIGPVSSLTARTAANLADADSFYLDDGAGADLRLTLLVLKQFLATATLAAGTLTVSSPFMLTQTWNDGGVTFRGKENVFTITAAAAGSTVERWLGGAAGAPVLASLSAVWVLTLGDRLNVPALNGMTMSSSEPNYGNVLNIGANSWQMGFSSAQTTAGTAAITWTDNAGIILTPVNSLVQWMGTTAAFPAIGRVAVTGGWGLTLHSAANTNGQAVGFEAVTEETTIAAAATTDTAIQIPANVIVLGVSVRVTVVIPTAATFTVIGATTATAFQTGASVSTAADTTDAGTKACPYLNTAAQAIRITPNAQPVDNTGRVRVTIHYIKVTVPTS